MSSSVHFVPKDFNARIGPRELEELHDLERADPDRFWLDQARRLTWNKLPTKAGDWSFAEDDFHIRWYADGELNLPDRDKLLAEMTDQVSALVLLVSGFAMVSFITAGMAGTATAAVATSTGSIVRSRIR